MSSAIIDGEEASPKIDIPVVETPKPKKRPWFTITGGVIAIIVAAYFGGHWALYDRYRVYTDDATIDTDPTYVTSRLTERVAQVLVDENQFVRKGDTLALLESDQERAALALAQRNLDAQRAAARAAVQAASLEGEVQTAQVQQQSAAVRAAEGDIAVARSKVNEARKSASIARANLALARSQVETADAAVPAAEETLRKAELDLRRDQALATQGYVPASTLDAATAAVAQARASRDAALAQTKSARLSVQAAAQALAQSEANASTATIGVGTAANQVPIISGRLAESAAAARVPGKIAEAQAAQAQVRALEAQVQQAALALANTKIVAPFDAWVAQRNAQEGQTVTAGQAIITLSPAKRIFVTANYKETQLAKIRPGMTAELTLDACGGKTVRGRVVAFAPVALNTLTTLPALSAPTNFVKVTQRVPVRIALPPADGSCAYRVGTMVEVAVLTK